MKVVMEDLLDDFHEDYELVIPGKLAELCFLKFASEQMVTDNLAKVHEMVAQNDFLVRPNKTKEERDAGNIFWIIIPKIVEILQATRQQLIISWGRRQLYWQRELRKDKITLIGRDDDGTWVWESKAHSILKNIQATKEHGICEEE